MNGNNERGGRSKSETKEVTTVVKAAAMLYCVSRNFKDTRSKDREEVKALRIGERLTSNQLQLRGHCLEERNPKSHA
jgi:hypothetical protein